jgi:zinc/manganese transport system substrate-binding protein
VANIADGLAATEPGGAAYYRARAAAYDKRLASLDAWIRTEIASVPSDRRKALTGHDSFEYFARAYGVRFAAPRGYNSDSEPTARDMATLIREVRSEKIRALFVENLTKPALIDEIARDSGASVGPRLYSDALSKPGGPAPDYETMMRYNVTALVAGMKKHCAQGSRRIRRRRTAGRPCAASPAACCTSGRPLSSARHRPVRA